MTTEDIRNTDSQNMFEILKNFPEQVKEANKIGREAPGFSNKIKSDKYLVLGMGGSAIGGSLLKSYVSALDGASHISIEVNRNYSIPGYISNDANIIASSYSGETEETLTALDKACKITNNIIAVTSGGKLESFSRSLELPIIIIPGGLQPRCAIGYSFFPMLHTVMKSGSFRQEAIEETENAIPELTAMLEKKSLIYSDIGNSDNLALELAGKLRGKIPVFYSSGDIFEAVNLRWRGQIQENAKMPAFGAFLPEMNHNEINGWTAPKEIVNPFIILLIRDLSDHNRVKARFDALQALLKDYTGEALTLSGEGEFLLTRFFSLIYLADWTSFYLAILNESDPTPIPLIGKLKTALSKI